MSSNYELLVQGIQECSECSFRDPDIEPLPPQFVKSPVPLMFIGENPSWEKEQDMLFAHTTTSGQALDRHYLEPLNLTREQVWITERYLPHET